MKKAIVYTFVTAMIMAFAFQMLSTYASYKGIPKVVSKSSKAMFGITLK